MTNVTNIATVAIGIIKLIEVGQEIYQATVNAMDAVERKGALSGRDKKEWVLEFAKLNAIELGLDWKLWFHLISDFIDELKAIYNSVKYLF